MLEFQVFDKTPNVLQSSEAWEMNAVSNQDVFCHVNRASRYLLILTENGAALRIIQQQVLRGEDDAVVIFGSRFPKDQDYTQVICIIGPFRLEMTKKVYKTEYEIKSR